MREIKFRAWDKVDKKWLRIGFIAFDNRDSYLAKGSHYCLMTTDGNLFPKDRYDLLMFTGLLDKNGKEVYEGDIIRHICLETVFDEGKYKQIEESRIKYSGQFDNIDEYEEYCRKECMKEGEVTRICPVKYDKGHFYLEREENQWLFFGVGKNHSEEVIGNIYENQDLLTQRS